MTSPIGLTIQTIKSMREYFKDVHQEALKTDPDALLHDPSPKLWDDLMTTSMAMESVIKGEYVSPKYYICDLPTGVGKTTLVTHFLRNMVKSGMCEDVGVLICVPLLSEVDELTEELIESLGISSDDVAIYTGTRKDHCDDKQILLTTHRMIEQRLSDGRELAVMNYKGQPRLLKIYDEECVNFVEHNLDIDCLMTLPRVFTRMKRPDIASRLRKVAMEIMSLPQGKPYKFPDFREDYGLTLEDITRDIRGKKQLNMGEADALMCIYYQSGKTVRVHSKALGNEEDDTGRITLTWDTKLPDEFPPVFVFDASARVRKLYRMMAKKHGNMQWLTNAPKYFEKMLVKHIEVAAGQTAWADHTEKLAQGVAEIVLKHSGDKILIAGHKSTRIEDHVLPLLDADHGNTLHFETWGRLKQTNKYRDCNVMIIGGIMYLPQHVIYGRTRAANGVEGDEELENDKLITAMWEGEVLNDLLQAAGRIRARFCNGDQAPECTLYIFASNKAPHGSVRKLIETAFPGAKYMLEGLKSIKGRAPGKKAKEALDYLDGCLLFNPEANEGIKPLATFQEVYDRIGMSRGNFRRVVRNSLVFQRELHKRNVMEKAAAFWVLQNSPLGEG